MHIYIWLFGLHDFYYMTGERSSQRIAAKKMVLSDEIKTYFNNLIKPLSTSSSLEELFKTFTDQIVFKIEKRLDDQEEKIQEQSSKIAELESNLSVRQNTIDKLLTHIKNKTDENEQYSRRSCLRINGVEVVNNENISSTLKNCYENAGIEYNPNEIDRVHRIGNRYKDKHNNKLCQSIIVKFKSWESRCMFYNNRPKGFTNGVKRSSPLPFTCNVDLTKSRFNLMKDMRGLTAHYPDIKFVYADINCNLAIRFKNDEVSLFNTKAKLDVILGNLNFIETS